MMQTVSTIRAWEVEQLRKSLPIVSSLFRLLPYKAFTVWRDGGTGWTGLEVLCHLGDYEAIFLERAKVTVERDNPMLPRPDQAVMAREGNYNEQNPDEALEVWTQRRAEFLAYLESLAEAAWERTATHPRRGSMLLHHQLSLTAWHDVNHLEQFTRILAEKRTQE
jgi:hypothetical protein